MIKEVFLFLINGQLMGITFSKFIFFLNSTERHLATPAITERKKEPRGVFSCMIYLFTKLFHSTYH